MPLSADRKAQFEEAFEIIGKKATEIERMDVGIIMRSLGQNPTNDEVKELFEKVAGGESSIPLEKMLKVADEFETRMKASDQTTVLKEAFAVFDKDNSGSISAAELRHVIANLDESVDEDETDEMMKMADADGARARLGHTHLHTANRSLSLSLPTLLLRLLSLPTLLLREQATESSITTNSCRCCWAARTGSRRPSRYPTI